MISQIGNTLRFATLALALNGCASALNQEQALDSIAAFVPYVDPILRQMYADAQEACLDEATDTARRQCVANVRAKFAKVIEGLQALRVVWCRAVPEQCNELEGLGE